MPERFPPPSNDALPERTDEHAAGMAALIMSRQNTALLRTPEGVYRLNEWQERCSVLDVGVFGRSRRHMPAGPFDYRGEGIIAFASNDWAPAKMQDRITNKITAYPYDAQNACYDRTGEGIDLRGERAKFCRERLSTFVEHRENVRAVFFRFRKPNGSRLALVPRQPSNLQDIGSGSDDIVYADLIHTTDGVEPAEFLRTLVSGLDPERARPRIKDNLGAESITNQRTRPEANRELTFSSRDETRLCGQLFALVCQNFLVTDTDDLSRLASLPWLYPQVHGWAIVEPAFFGGGTDLGPIILGIEDLKDAKTNAVAREQGLYGYDAYSKEIEELKRAFVARNPRFDVLFGTVSDWRERKALMTAFARKDITQLREMREKALPWLKAVCRPAELRFIFSDRWEDINDL